MSTTQPPTESGLGMDEALDIVEGLVGGGVIGVGTYIIAAAVQALPGSFLASAGPAVVTALSAITGAMTFVGIAVHQIRQRRT